MSETRYDWLADRWVIFAPHRSQRPDEFVATSHPAASSIIECPFCLGREAFTPGEVLQLPAKKKSSQAWMVRVVPNKYPALEPLPELFAEPAFENYRNEPLSMGSGFATSTERATATVDYPITSIHFRRKLLQGAHEVIIESPQHSHSLTELSESHVLLVFQAFRQRLFHWRAHRSLRYSVVFKNMGSEAGASLSHSHSQLIATNFVPPDVQRSCCRQQEYLDKYHRGYFEDLIDQELAASERVILQTPNFVVVVPFASQVPYFMWVLPRIRQPRFEELSDRLLAEFSAIVRRMLRALESLFSHVAYNFVLHTSPFEAEWDQAFHWRMEIFPRLTKVAGFEWGSDCYINPVLPEYAAKELAKWA